MLGTSWVPNQNAFEPVQELGQAHHAEFSRAAKGLRLLILVIRAGANRVVRVVRFGHHVGNGQLDLLRPDPRRLAAGYQLQLRGQVLQDGGRLSDPHTAMLQKGRRERRMRKSVVLQTAQHCPHTLPRGLRATCHVDVRGAGRFERKPDEFAAALNRRPVMEFISHEPHYIRQADTAP